jgi:hypothetical protein
MQMVAAGTNETLSDYGADAVAAFRTLLGPFFL